MKKSMKFLSVLTGSALLFSMLPFYVSAAEGKGKVRVIVRNDTFTEAKGAKWDGVLFDKYVDIDNNSNAFTALVKAIEDNGYTCTGADTGYISAVNGLDASDGGSMGGWLGAIDDWIVDDSLSSFTVSSGKLRDGDVISFEYSLSWGSDLNYDWAGTDTSLLDLIVSGGTLLPAFSGSNTTYKLTVPAENTEISIVPKAVNRNFRTKIYKNNYTPAELGSDIQHGQSFTVSEGDIVYVGVANAAWSGITSTDIKETVYQISVNKETEVVDTAVNSVISLINVINVESPTYFEVYRARQEYDKLTDAQKEKVSNYDVLVKAEKDLFTVSVDYDKLVEMLDKIYPEPYEAGDEWKLIIRARCGQLSEDAKAKYLESVKKYVKEKGSNVLNDKMATENAKYVLALTAAGIDPVDIDGYDLTKPLMDYEYVSKQGINGVLYSLLALQSHNYAADTTVKEKYVLHILEAQTADGGWALTGDTADVDMTAIALQALAPYDSSEEVKADVHGAIEKALEFLSNAQYSNGSYPSFDGTLNAESTSQVMIALQALGIDIDTDSRFVKGGGSYLTGSTVFSGLLSFLKDDETFSHTMGGDSNVYATIQSYLAMAAYTRTVNKQTALYDMTDVIFATSKEESTKTESKTENKTSSVTSSSSVSSRSDASVSSASSSTEAAQANAVNTGDAGSSVWIALSVLTLSVVIFGILKKDYLLKTITDN